MNSTEFINAIFDVCAKIAKENVHYIVDENGMRVWNDTLHNVIQTACIQILNTFDKEEEDE